ncbi:hypothetical protein ACI5KX_09010 [Erythrobacter sp. GH1-10]|uniref:cobaltochelatase CobT-related protein n=1 Tax=Erythrobacter sp. GH1-10 TaxID=3349334 RepID=UPI003877C6E1
MAGYLLAVVIVLLSGLAIRDIAKSSKNTALLPDRPDLPYRAYTTHFDVECDGADLETVLKRSGNNITPTRKFDPGDTAHLIEKFGLARDKAIADASVVRLPDLSDHAVVLLVDQSGSLAEQMTTVAGQIQSSAERMEEAGARVLVAGFTTIGWHGGKSREAWSRAGRPGYPGRLCDLLHIIYSSFDERTEEHQLHPMFTLGAMFENVDGEALRWAAEKVAAARAVRKTIIVVSDGAPVDDSTLAANGPAILERDIRLAIEELESDPDVNLGAVGIDFDVSRYYSDASSFGSADEVTTKVLKTLQDFVS